MRPLVRILKHVSLAIFLIAAGLCMLEVGLRARHLKVALKGQQESQDAPPARPCPLAYQQLPSAFSGSVWSEETGTRVELTTNSFGLRGPEVAVPKPPGRYRVVCLGDEATLAPSIAEEETFCRLLREILQPDFEPQVEVINAGQPGHCPLLSLAWARARLVGLQPDLVILCCDVSDVGDDRRCRPLAKFDHSGRLLSVRHPATKDRPADWFSAVEHEFILARLLGKHLGDRLTEQLAPMDDDHDEGLPNGDAAKFDAAHPSALVEQAWEPIGSVKDLCRQIAADFVVTVVPSSATARSASAVDAAGAPDRIAEMLALLADRTNQEQIPMLDASPEFTQTAEETKLFLDSSGALSTDGHRLFAEILGQALLARGNRESGPEAVPVSGELPAASESTAPLPNLERRPRAAD